MLRKTRSSPLRWKIQGISGARIFSFGLSAIKRAACMKPAGLVARIRPGGRLIACMDYPVMKRQPLIPERPIRDIFRGPGTSGTA